MTRTIVLLSAAMWATGVRGSPPPDPRDPAAISQLAGEIGRALAETGGVGASVALADGDGPIWTAGFGWADVGGHRPATARTQFPLGSTSKLLVSLSVLKLQEQGCMSLSDTIQFRAPEVFHANRWEASDPVRIVDLLEHTAGWSDNTPAEAGWNLDSAGIAALGRPSTSRISRWRPGWEFAYSNAGPAVAAYIVGKVAKVGFPAYVRQTWFAPLDMPDATYDTGGSADRATCYGTGGTEIAPGTGEFLWPAGGAWASARDLANWLVFFVRRGEFHGRRLLTAASLDRMERPESTAAARAGLAAGYGLGNAATVSGSWLFHGHGGVVRGGMANFLYAVPPGLGYAVMINSENSAAMSRIETLLQSYLLRGRPSRLPSPPDRSDVLSPIETDGWYEPITPRDQGDQYLERILGITRVRVRGPDLTTADLTNGRRHYVQVHARQFRRRGQVDPTLALIRLPTGGAGLQFGGGPTFRRIPRPLGAALFLGGAIWTLSVLLVLAAAIGPGGHDHRVRHAALLKAIAAGAATALLIWFGSGDYYARANGAALPVSTAGLLAAIAEGLLVVYGLRGARAGLRALRKEGPSVMRWGALVAILGLEAGGIYLLAGGLLRNAGFEI